jgi:hypothetical protein
MHVSAHRPFFPVWTPSQAAEKAHSNPPDHHALARIAEDLKRRGNGRALPPNPSQRDANGRRNESAARQHQADSSFDSAAVGPATLATFDLTLLNSMNTEGEGGAVGEVEEAKESVDRPRELSLNDLLAVIISAD